MYTPAQRNSSIEEGRTIVRMSVEPPVDGGTPVASSPDLIVAIGTWVAHWNADPEPFVWHAETNKMSSPRTQDPVTSQGRDGHEPWRLRRVCAYRPSKTANAPSILEWSPVALSSSMRPRMTARARVAWAWAVTWSGLDGLSSSVNWGSQSST